MGAHLGPRTSGNTPYIISIVSSGLILNLDAGNLSSYPGTGATWTDLSSSGLNATLVNSPTYSSLNNGHLIFNGSTQYAQISDNALLRSTTGTISFWFNPSAIPSGPPAVIVSKHDAGGSFSGYSVGIQSDGSVFFQVKGGGQADSSAAGTISVGNWYNVTFVYNSGVLYSFYLNGVLINSAALEAFTITSGQPLRIARSVDGYWNTYQGGLSNLSIYNRALTSSEVLQNWNATKSRFGL